jgi:hypothetical protein
MPPFTTMEEWIRWDLRQRRPRRLWPPRRRYPYDWAVQGL